MAQYDVEGLDLDVAMPEITGQELPGIRHHQASMVNLNIDQQFSVIVCLSSPIGYVRTGTRLENATENMARHSEPGGLVVVELSIYPEGFEPAKQHAVSAESLDG